MLRIAGRLADGWLPTNIRPDAYAEKLGAIRESAEQAGRDPDAITPSMLAYVICAPDEETLERMCASPMARVLFAAVDLPPETYARHGSTSPFEGGTGFHSFLPTTVTREEASGSSPHPGRDRARAHPVRDAGDDRRRSPLRRGRPARRRAVEHHAVRRSGAVRVLVPGAARAAGAAVGDGRVSTLEGRVALVTGASRGIGRGIALALAARAPRVGVNYRRDAEAAEEVVRHRGRGGGAVALQASMSELERGGRARRRRAGGARPGGSARAQRRDRQSRPAGGRHRPGRACTA